MELEDSSEDENVRCFTIEDEMSYPPMEIEEQEERKRCMTMAGPSS